MMNIETVCKNFLDSLDSKRLSSTTLASIRSNVNMILKNVENRPFNELVEEDFVKIIQRLRSSNKELSLRQKWTTINAIRQYARREGIIDDDKPWAFPKPELVKSENIPEESQGLVLRKIRENVEHILMEILFRENLEMKKILALRVRDVHFDPDYVKICQFAINRRNRLVVKKSKTEHVVYFSHESMELLQQTIIERKKWFFSSESCSWEDCLIFADKENCLPLASHYVRAFKQLSEQCGIEINDKNLSQAKFQPERVCETAGESLNASLKKFRKYHTISTFEQKKIMKQDSSIVQNAFLQFKLITGTRTAEILGLTWDKVRRDNHTVHIQNQLVGGHNKSLRMIRSTKNFRQRVLHLPEIAFKILEKIQEKTRGILSPVGKYDFIFCNADGSPLNQNDMNKWLRKVLGYEDVFLHNLRSTAATVMYNATGVVSNSTRLLGHLDEAVTEEHYVDVIPDTGAVALSLSNYYRRMGQ